MAVSLHTACTFLSLSVPQRTAAPPPAPAPRSSFFLLFSLYSPSSSRSSSLPPFSLSLSLVLLVCPISFSVPPFLLFLRPKRALTLRD